MNLTTTTVSAATYSLGAPVARESIILLFGNSFGSSPTVKVTSPTQESSAYVFYSSPTQINYQIPPGISTGIATVTITANDGSVAMGLTKIVDVMPGIFTASASSRAYWSGAPSAVVAWTGRGWTVGGAVPGGASDSYCGMR